VSLFNRWGDVVFETEDYNNKDRVFRGLNKNGDELPTDNYFYKIEFQGGRPTATGYISLKR
jgi:gliding motility-associated-like protein